MKETTARTLRTLLIVAVAAAVFGAIVGRVLIDSFA